MILKKQMTKPTAAECKGWIDMLRGLNTPHAEQPTARPTASASPINTPRRHNDESILQAKCVRWFRSRYPRFASLLFAVPNGHYRTAREAQQLKAEGVVPGVADLVYLSGNGAVFIEMKTPNGRQSQAQRNFEHLVSARGYKYIIIRTFEDFTALFEPNA